MEVVLGRLTTFSVSCSEVRDVPTTEAAVPKGGSAGSMQIGQVENVVVQPIVHRPAGVFYETAPLAEVISCHGRPAT